MGYLLRVPASVPCCFDELIDWLRTRFDGKASRDLVAVVQLDLGGQGGGSLVMRIETGRAEIGRGTVANPDVRLRVPAGDFFAVISGTVSPDVLHMQGRLEVEGDLSLAMKLRTLFPTR